MPEVGRELQRRARLAVLLVVGAALLLATPARAEFGPLDSWGGTGEAPGLFNSPSDVAVGPDGDVYVADTFNHRIQVFDRCHRVAGEWGGLGSGAGQLNSPLGLAVGAGDRVYVADTNNSRIEVFDPSGSPLGGWGGFGSGAGQLRLPFDVAVGPRGDVYVADTDNDRIQRFDESGALVSQWGKFGSGNGQFSLPHGIAVGPDGDVYVADTFNHRVQVFSATGEFIRKWGGFGSADGQFRTPRGVAVGPTGEVFVADTYNDRIQRFQPSGAFLGAWGSQGSGLGQFQYAAGVATGPRGSVYVAEDYPNDRIQQFGEPLPTIGDLVDAVRGLGLHRGLENSLLAKLRAAARLADRGRSHAAANSLRALVAELRAQSGKKIGDADAAALIADAEAVGSSLRCLCSTTAGDPLVRWRRGRPAARDRHRAAPRGAGRRHRERRSVGR